MKVETPGDVRVTLTCTMTVGQWSKVSDALTGSLQGRDQWQADVAALRNAIDEAIRKIAAQVSGDSIPLVQ